MAQCQQSTGLEQVPEADDRVPLSGRHQLSRQRRGWRRVAAAGGAVGCLAGAPRKLAAAAIHGRHRCQADGVPDAGVHAGRVAHEPQLSILGTSGPGPSDCYPRTQRLVWGASLVASHLSVGMGSRLRRGRKEAAVSQHRALGSALQPAPVCRCRRRARLTFHLACVN